MPGGDGDEAEARIRVGVVPHTHWDREWHVPFQAGRVRLLRLLDAVLDGLESGGLPCFWLDGQTAAVDDYLAVRPQAQGRVRAAITAGRLAVGPWVVPMDEFVVSAETIIRNLAAGMARRAELGADGPAVGYGPDIFGHVAQLPQLLRMAGIDLAVVWRGVPEVVGAATTAFRWEAPDGSKVRTEYLFGSYANGRSLPPDGPGLVDRTRSWEEEVGPRRVEGLLLMNGGDQRPAEAWVTAAVAEANSAGDRPGGSEDGNRYRFDVVDLAAWLEAEREAVPDEALPLWRGELRSSAAAPVLGGVISNRVDVRAAAAAAERAVERRAEPLLALFQPPRQWTDAAPLLDLAWERLIANSAHDSACACCSDAVADQVLARYAEARQVGDALADEALADLAVEVGAGPEDVLVVNTRPATRSAVVEVTVPSGPDRIPRAAQILDETRDEVFATRVAGSKVGWVADRISAFAFDGQPVRAWSFEPEPERLLRFEAAGPAEAPVDLIEARHKLLALGRDGLPVSVRMLGPPQRRILLATGPVAGYGWTTRRAGDSPTDPVPAAKPVLVSMQALDNGIVRVEIDPDDGTIALATGTGLRAAGLNRYVDGGDGGDTYTWCPPTLDTVVDRPIAVTLDVEEPGPLRGRVAITATYDWPVRADGDDRFCTARSSTTTAVTVTTTVSLTAGDPVVAVETAFDNRCRDHRLRVHFPLPAQADASDAGCAFAVVRRGLEVEGGPAETPPPTFPARRFVDCAGEAAGLAFIADGSFEYEVLDGGRELAVTLLRATGWLSRRRLASRPDPAGPALPVEGAQMQGRRRWRYGLLLHAAGWEAAQLPRQADAFLNPLEAVAGSTATGLLTRPPVGQALQVEGAEVSAVRRDAGDLVVRLFNPGSTPTAAVVDGENVSLRAGQIATVSIGRRPGGG